MKFTTSESTHSDQCSVIAGRHQVIPGIQDQPINDPGTGFDQFVNTFHISEFASKAFICSSHRKLERLDELSIGLLTSVDNEGIGIQATGSHCRSF
jgi:hypothetical protein